MPKRRRALINSGMIPTDAELIARELRGTGTAIVPVHMSEKELLAIGTSFGSRMPRPSSNPISWPRRAPPLAQALWSAYMVVNCSAAERRILFAAYRAWMAIEGASGRWAPKNVFVPES